MRDIDVDEVREVNYADDASSVEVIFKNGESEVYRGEDLAFALETLNHWTPPTA
jgi:hypothetical protein